MNKQTGDLADLIREHVQALDPYADVILLFPQGTEMHQDIQLYILTPEKVDFSVEQQYLDAKYKVELDASQSLSLYVYSKEDWHKQFVETPIYKQVQLEGIYL
ncbi:hypothetical protein [Carboxylicivirga sp. M1479]|uniref:hypothetical protein n=1 Tax=Carboxylicivirga sp. M1479 TaxID=2594476 RepID=UPI0011784376|nr:hypothetical protein [Carboxylicivirga sp. M1479]TRX63289.1 hypothetical protein FNN09_18740 [Carboxylicivirga sp. M1479]